MLWERGGQNGEEGELELRFEEAPALATMRLRRIRPGEAERLLPTLASDRNLPALQTVEMKVAGEPLRLRAVHAGMVTLAPWCLWRTGCSRRWERPARRNGTSWSMS